MMFMAGASEVFVPLCYFFHNIVNHQMNIFKQIVGQIALFTVCFQNVSSNILRIAQSLNVNHLYSQLFTQFFIIPLKKFTLSESYSIYILWF